MPIRLDKIDGVMVEKKEIKPKLEWYDHKTKQNLVSYCGSKDCDTHTTCAHSIGIKYGYNEAIDQIGQVEITLNREKLAEVLYKNSSEYPLDKVPFGLLDEYKANFYRKDADAIISNFPDIVEVVK